MLLEIQNKRELELIADALLVWIGRSADQAPLASLGSDSDARLAMILRKRVVLLGVNNGIIIL